MMSRDYRSFRVVVDNMAYHSYVHFVLLALTFATSYSLTRQSLNGTWVASADGNIDLQDIEATVPGGIFSDLMNNDKIADIFSQYGDSNYSWVGSTDWTYTTTFTVNEALLNYRVVNLVCEGLDTFATVFINGQTVGTTANMFVRYVFDVKQFMQVGNNSISVAFTSPVRKAADLKQNSNNSYSIPPDCPPDEFKGICFVNLIRKMQASFSWDWGPAFASVGIWKDIYLIGFDSAAIEHVVATPTQNTETLEWTVEIKTYCDAGEVHAISGAIHAVLELDDESISSSTVAVPESSVNGLHVVFKNTINVTFDSVKQWWPNGYGTQTLYNLTVIFVSSDGEQDEKTTRIGFRTIELVQEELAGGLNFFFAVNGNPFFAKGANEIPINILPERGQDKETVRNVLGSARDANMNMLRVWGGGVYESDYFYDLADEYGILIWQDFMFACAMYPGDEAFLGNAREEVRHQLKRLGSHPSIAIWAGNNENEAILQQNLYNTSYDHEDYARDYVKLYVNVIAEEVAEILPQAPYVTSSPSNGLESANEGYLAQNPGDSLYGDVHFYDYYSDSWKVSTFPIPRFASEYGYQSMPSLEAWKTVTDNLDEVNPTSDLLNNRQHHPGGNNQNVELILKQLQLPDISSPNYKEAFIYFSQIVQAQSIRTETEHYRSFKGRLDANGQGHTMGALFWQLNDVWVAPTWSGIDFTGRWKMLHYFARDFFDPMIITGRLVDENLELYAVLDALQEPNYTVLALVHIYQWDTLRPLLAIEFPVTPDPTKSVLITTIHAPTALETAGCGSDYAKAKSRCFFHLHLIDTDNNFIVPFNYIFPEKLKNSNLANATVQIASVQETEERNRFEIVVRTDAVALFVWLDSHDIKGRFSQNGFLQPIPEWTVYFTSYEAVTLDALTASLTVTHLRDPAYL